MGGLMFCGGLVGGLMFCGGLVFCGGLMGGFVSCGGLVRMFFVVFDDFVNGLVF